MTGDGQAEALDRVGEDDTRPLGHRVALGEGVQQRSHVMAAEVGDDLDAELVVVLRAGPRRPRTGRRRGTGLARPPGATPKTDWYCSLGMTSSQSRRAAPPGWSKAARSRRPYLTSTTCHPAAENCAVHCSMRTPGITRSSDCRLKSTIHITSPRPAVDRVGDGLPHVALVELGVPDQRDEARALPGTEVGVDVAAHRGREQRGGRTEPDRPRREVDAIGILRAGRVRLQPAELPQTSSGTCGRGRPGGS